MSEFIANGFSRKVSGLLRPLFFLFLAPVFCLSKPLKINEESSMPPARTEVPSQKKWNVEALYSDARLWSEELSKAKGQDLAPRWPELKAFRGRLGDPLAMAQFLERYLSLDRMLTKLATYAHLRMDEDLGNDEFKRNFGLILILSHDFRLETSWLEPEILALSDAEISHLMKEPSLGLYKFYFQRLLSMRPHTLSSDKEELVALAGKAMDASAKAFQALNNADLTFRPAIDSMGNEHSLTNGTYATYIHSPDRNLRKSTIVNLHEGFSLHANTLCELLQGNVQAHLFQAKARQFPDCITAALLDKQIDPAVVRQLIATVRKGRALMDEYLLLRKEALKLDAVHVYDLAAPLVAPKEEKMTYEQACQMVIESVAPLGAEYQQALRKGLIEDRWVDPFENARKRSGAYSSGCYDSMPYILMNFHGTLYDTMTLAHEAGHSMHSYFSRKHQPYIYADYSIFVAEVASTFNEQLLMDHLMKKAKTKSEKAYLLSDQIDRIRGTVIRQTLLAEFELKIHELAEQGQPLTPKLLNQIYIDLMRDYYGSNLVIDPEIEIEWARIPHFYSNFYVYQYATGVSAAMALHEQVLKSTEARDRYLKFLSSGGSKYPLEILKEAGVDMTTSAPVEAALARFAYLIRELRKNL